MALYDFGNNNPLVQDVFANMRSMPRFRMRHGTSPHASMAPIKLAGRNHSSILFIHDAQEHFCKSTLALDKEKQNTMAPES